MSTLLLALYFYAFYSEIRFARSLAEYLDPVPVRRVLAQIAREKAWSIAALTLLVAGAVAELRRKAVAAVINTAGYALIVVLFAWDCVSLVEHPEHLMPYLLEAGVPSLLIPVCALLLYRCEISAWCEAANSLLFMRKADGGV